MPSSTSTAHKKLLNSLRKDFSAYRFKAAKSAYWSPKEQTIFYKEQLTEDRDIWALLHELGHAELQHATFLTDFELLKMEVQAWDKAKEIALRFDILISGDHIDNCLDSYRDWLHKRSTCPSCGIRTLQINTREYLCINCRTKWRVAPSRFCRVYRRVM